MCRFVTAFIVLVFGSVVHSDENDRAAPAANNLIGSGIGSAEDGYFGSTSSGPEENTGFRSRPKTKIFDIHLEHARAEDVVKVMNEQFDSYVFSAEPTTNCLYVRLPEKDGTNDEIFNFAERLDQVARHIMDERRAEEELRRKIEEDRRDDALEDASQQLTVEAEFIEASELVDILENLKLLNDRLSAAASPQGNVVILRGSKNAVDEARQLISSLDTEPEQSADSNARLEDFRIRTLFPLMQEESLLKDQLGDGHPKLMAIRKRIETAEQQLDELFGTSNEASLDLDILEFEVSEPVDVEDAQRKYAAAEQRTVQIAKRLRNLKSHEGEDNEQVEEIRQSLADAVATAFELRMTLQEAQLSKALIDLQKARNRIARRKTLADEIIDRRVEELENADLTSWSTVEIANPEDSEEEDESELNPDVADPEVGIESSDAGF